MYRLAQIGLLLLAACLLFAVMVISAAMMTALRDGATQNLLALTFAWLISVAGVVGCFWKSKKLRVKQEDISPLPASAGPLTVPVRKVGVAIFVGVGTLLLWLLMTFFLVQLNVEYAFLISFLAAAALVVPLSLKMFTAEYYLRIDQAGLHHYRIGDIPWPDVSGIRIGSITVKGSTKYHLMVMVKRPDRYADRMGSWFMFFHRKTLLEKHTLTFPLQMASGNPAHVFEAAVRFRSAVSPPAITGWDGNRDALAPLVRWMQNNPLKVGMDRDDALMGQRIASTMAASYGGWSQLDTLETIRIRTEMNTLSQARVALVQARVDQAIANAESGRMHAGPDEAARTAERDFMDSADGRRLTTLQSQLQTQVATAQRRQRWQVVVAVVVIVIFYVGMLLLKHGGAR